MRATDSAGYAAWTLHDFSYVPAQVAGRAALAGRAGADLGVIRSDCTHKPAAALLAPGVALDVPRAPAWARFLKPFWMTIWSIPARYFRWAGKPPAGGCAGPCHRRSICWGRVRPRRRAGSSNLNRLSYGEHTEQREVC